MRHYKILLGFIISIGFSTFVSSWANAGTYTQENGVQIYRSGPTQAQKSAQLAHRIAAHKTQQHVAHHKAMMRQQMIATQNAYQSGYKDGQQQAQQQQNQASQTRNRYGYGRRYTTWAGPRYGYSYARRRHSHRRQR